MSARRAPASSPVSSAARTASPGIRRCSVAKCCSASVSVGAMKRGLHAVLDRAQHRVQRDDGLARADLAHEQALHRARPGEVGVELGASRARWSPVGANGSSSSRQRRDSAGAPSSDRRACSRRGGARGGAAATSWSSSSSSKASRRRPPSWSPKCAASSAAGAVGQPAAGPQRAPAAARRRRARPAVLAHEREDLRRGEPLGRRVVRDARPSPPVRSSVGAWLETRKRLRAAYLPCSTSRVPGGYLRCSHGWLKNVAFMTPVSSATVASTSGFIPRRRTGRLVIERTSTTTVATSSGDSVATVRASRRSRGRCSSRSPTVSRPSRSAASAAASALTFSGRASRDGRGQRSGASRSSARRARGRREGGRHAPMMARRGGPVRRADPWPSRPARRRARRGRS